MLGVTGLRFKVFELGPKMCTGCQDFRRMYMQVLEQGQKMCARCRDFGRMHPQVLEPGQKMCARCRDFGRMYLLLSVRFDWLCFEHSGAACG